MMKTADKYLSALVPLAISLAVTGSEDTSIVRISFCLASVILAGNPVIQSAYTLSDPRVYSILYWYAPIIMAHCCIRAVASGGILLSCPKIVHSG